MLTKILSYIKRYKLLLILSILMAITNVVTLLLIPYLFGITIDFIIDENNVNFGKLISNLTIIGILIILSSISSYLMNLTNNKVTYSFIKDIRNEFQNCLSSKIAL
jgi:ATP-binding cassette subfamily B protein